MNDSYHREEELFAAALARPTAERAGFLREACAGDADLRTRVEDLLRHAAGGGDFLDTPPERELAEAARAAREALPGDEPPGTCIGRYTLREKVGEGGCGVVYRAEQTEPVRREVALKIIKLGMDTREVIARFAAERQALALMDHPHIARVFDAGATESGRPFFAMELVPGTKITEWCDEHRLGLEERLRLFVQVCAAVQHAHQKGIIHRDLKPSNILVSSQDGAPVPKVIDFGIAKATQGKLTEHTLVTAVEQLIGTPAYMSPEQVERGGADVDTRSDIYSLGVLLYELLTGCTPVDLAELRQTSVDEIRRRIREQEPPRPSVRLRALDRETRTIAASRRRLEPDQLVRRLNGDLDWIALRCLEKERGRRYETVNGLAHDLERFLQHEPVHARPPGRVYLFAKFIRRHRFGVAAGAAVVLALLAGLVVSTTLYFRVTAALTRAEAEKRHAETEAARSATVARFMQDMLEGVRPNVAGGRDTALLRDILDATAKRLDTQLKDQPAVEADLRTTLGQVYYALRERPQAEAMRRAALALRQRAYGPEHLKVAESLAAIAEAALSNGKIAEAETLAREALAMWRKLAGQDDPGTLPILGVLGSCIIAQHRDADALAMLLETRALRKKIRPSTESGGLAADIQLGRLLVAAGRFDEAEAISRECLVGARARRPKGMESETLDEANALEALATVLAARGSLAEAESCFRETLAIMRRYLVSGRPYGRLAEVASFLGDVLFQEGKWAEAEAAQREGVAIRRTVAEADAPPVADWLHVVTSMYPLVTTLCMEKKYAEAEQVCRDALALCPKFSNRRPGGAAEAHFRLGDVFAAQDKWAQAEAAYRAAWEAQKTIGGDWPVYFIVLGLHTTLARQGRPTEMEPFWTEMIARTREPLDVRNDEQAGTYTYALLGALLQCDESVRAEPVVRENVARWEAVLPTGWQTFAFRSQLGSVLVRSKRFAEAEPLLLSSLAGLERTRGTIPVNPEGKLRFVTTSLVQLYTAWGKPEQAAEWRRKGGDPDPGAQP